MGKSVGIFEMEEEFPAEPKTRIQGKLSFPWMFIHEAIWELFPAIQAFCARTKSCPEDLYIGKLILEFIEELGFFHLWTAAESNRYFLRARQMCSLYH